MNINIKNVICIDLRPLSGKSLKRVAESLNISFSQLDGFKKSGIIKVWTEADSEFYIAFQKKGEDIRIQKEYCPMSKRETKQLSNITPITYQSTKTKVNVSSFTKSVVDKKVILDLDVILDKISSNGIDSLTKEELNFLKNIK